MANRSSAAEMMMRTQCEQEFTKADTDCSGTISYEELVPAMQAMHARVGLKEPTSEKVQKALTQFDTNKDGVLDLDEFQDLVAQVMLKAEKLPLPPNMVAMKKQSLEMFDQIATDGKLGKQEFVSISQAMIKSFLMMPVMMVGSSEGPCGPFGPDMQPALQRAAESLDMTGLQQILSLIHEFIDKDHNGTVERKEVKAFWDLFAGMMNQSQEASIDFAWQLVDQNGDGKVSLDEMTGLVAKLITILGSLMKALFETMDNLVTSPEARAVELKLVQMSPVMMMDANGDGVVSRAEFKDFLLQNDVAGTIEGLISQLQMASAQNPAMFDSIKNLRASLAETEKGFYNKLWLKAASWTNSGVDEVTFLATVVPIMKEQLAQPIDFVAIQTNMNKMQQQIQADTGVQQNAIQINVMESFQKNPEIIAIQKKVQEQSQQTVAQYAPEICRNMFRLLDIDQSGRISTREINVLKALMDGFLRIGTSTAIGSNALTEDETKQMKAMYPDLFKEGAGKPTIQQEAMALLLAIFDVIDRDGDGSLQQDEIVGFVTSVVSFLLQHMKIMSMVMVDCMIAMEKEMMKLLWTKLGITEVSKEQVPEVGMSIMMLAMSMVPQGGGDTQ